MVLFCFPSILEGRPNIDICSTERSCSAAAHHCHASAPPACRCVTGSCHMHVASCTRTAVAPCTDQARHLRWARTACDPIKGVTSAKSLFWAAAVDARWAVSRLTSPPQPGQLAARCLCTGCLTPEIAMTAALGEQFWQHAAGATALRVLLAAAGLDSYLESRIEVQLYAFMNRYMQSDLSVQ